MSRRLYSLLLLLAAPLFLLHLLLRSRRQPEYRQHWGERFGVYRNHGPRTGRLIWMHAVSVGETRAAQPLVAALLKAYPSASILMTHTTPTGRAVSLELFATEAQRVQSVYLPYDYSFAVRRFLRHFQPVLGVLMETEVWPNLVAECHAAGIPVALVNARLSEKSLRKAQRWSALLRPALQTLSVIEAQSVGDAERLRVAGAGQVKVSGNLKFDSTPPEAQLERGLQFRQAVGARPVLLAASTRDGEELLLLDAFQSARAVLPEEVLLVIVPRHPQRFDAVAALIESRGLHVQRRSAGLPLAKASQILLGDSMGELFTWYAAADLAFIGGSLLPLGGQNLIEACAVGCPVLIGPYTYNFSQATDDAIAAGAALRVAAAEELMTQAAALFKDQARRARMSVQALEFATAHRGATRRTLSALAPFLKEA
jgi:3-deoxy-D-manno-octulosonic-acid transferase